MSKTRTKVKVDEEALPGVETPQAPEVKTKNSKPGGNDFMWGYTRGFKEGFNAGLKSNVDLVNASRLGFDDGVRHIVTLAENYLARELGLPSREALAQSDKLPTWWMAALVTGFCESKNGLAD
jgi:hypothetical protein